MVGLLLVFVVATPIAAIAITYLVFFEDGAKSSGRWGFRRNKVAVGASPYRAGEATEELPQGAPLWLRFASWLCAMGGVVTTALLAPAGLILTAVVAGHGGLACLPVLLVSVSGFPAGVLLVRVARRVTRHEAVRPAIFHYLYVHHACVAATMLLVDAMERGGFYLSSASILICLAVLIPAMSVHAAARTLGERPRPAGHTE